MPGGSFGHRSSGIFLTVVLLVASGRTAWDYFNVYAHSPAMRGAYTTDLAAVGRYLATSPIWAANRANVYFPADWSVNRGTIAYFLYPRMTPAERPNWIDEDAIGTFVDFGNAVPVPNGPSLYLVPASDPTTARLLGSAVRSITSIEDNGTVVARAIQAGPAAPVSPTLGIHFGSWLELESATSDGQETTLRWKALAKPPYPPSIFLHVEDAERHTIAQGDAEVGLPLVSWRVGQEIVTRHVPDWPPGTPPGVYPLTVGVYDKASGKRETPTRDGQVLTEVQAGTMTLTRAIGGVPTAPRALAVNVAPGLDLRGAELPAAPVEAGTSIPLTLIWRASGTTRTDDEVGLILRAADESTVVEWWGRPATSFPTSAWAPGQAIRQIQNLAIPAGASGALTLAVAARPIGGSPGPANAIGVVRVTPSTHDFRAPKPALPLNARFIGVGTLVGADLPASGTAGASVRVVLYWRADVAAPVPYTVFVHVLDAKSQVVGQRDEPPLAGTRPTTGWVQGEYLADPHDVPIDPKTPPGVYQVEVGMYDPTNGARVETGTTDNRIVIGSIKIGS